MKNTLFFLILIITVSSCNFFTSSNKSSNYNSSYEYYKLVEVDEAGEKKEMIERVNSSIPDPVPDDYWVFTDDSNFGGGLAGESNFFSKTDTINFDIHIDSSLTDNWKEYEKSVSVINIILRNLKSGYAVKFNLVDSTRNLSKYSTEGRLNQNNIFEALGESPAKDQIGEGEFKLFLFKDSKFFNTANAVCLPHGKNSYIFGDGNLLYSPMLFIHELGHALGLTHYNIKPYEGCNSYNVMHESNIGCALHFTRRQIMMAHSGRYVPPMKDEEQPRACDCNHDRINSIEEEYLNSIDRNIDDTPIVSNYLTMFSDVYIEELKNGNLDVDVENSLLENFGKEWDSIIVNSPGTSRAEYISDRLDVHKKLRRNNLIRWIREIDMANNPSFDKDTLYFAQQQDFFDIKIEEIHEMKCNTVLNNVINLANEIDQYLNIFENDSSIFICYEEALDSIFTVLNKPEDGQRASISEQDISKMQFTKNVLEIFLRKDARQTTPNIRSRRKK
ncbi:MAG: hypothetical protein P1U56_19410 [Saprospiraceae bacterium]|nr:hypothetical protein [Saprospiraceae bacterium]